MARQQATIDALDRGLQYGDGLFETIAVTGWPAALSGLASSSDSRMARAGSDFLRST